MTQEEILEGNKLIAEFMGGIYSHYASAWGFGNARIEHEDLKVQGKVYKNAVWAERFETELKYHSSWDWLMPCIGKISNKCEEPEELDGLKYALLTNNIEESWKFVVSYLTIC